MKIERKKKFEFFVQSAFVRVHWFPFNIKEVTDRRTGQNSAVKKFTSKISCKIQSSIDFSALGEKNVSSCAFITNSYYIELNVYVWLCKIIL